MDCCYSFQVQQIGGV